ncbi:MAG TPA: penicillin-insensitive murein endopeptidase [Candidatus Saccharimonadales bacterium]|nr:penicillin-insensitive murein endopeptidase [Candidatus Saccharimonadales bacterium]
MTTTIRRSLLLPIAALAILANVGVVQASTLSDTFPTQSLGNRGSNVRAIQGLLRAHGSAIKVDGIFATGTKDAVKSFQQRHGLTVDGVVKAATWNALVVPLKTGATGEGVLALQRLLNEKRGAKLELTGGFGTGTRAAVESFQRHYGMTVWGSVGPVTWRRLIAHFEYPVWSDRLCDYSVGNGTANWGTGAAIGQLEAAAARIVKLGHGKVSLGDISYQHGGDIPGHQTHEQGLDVDIRPMRDAENQCTWGTNWRYTSYDRAATRDLVKAIRATAPGHIKVIYFNDPVLIDEGLTTWYTGHDDHVHVRYCELTHPLKTYDC